MLKNKLQNIEKKKKKEKKDHFFTKKIRKSLNSN